MKVQLRNTSHPQRGAVLVVSLIMLAVMTLFVISMLKTSVIELKIGGASHVAALNFSNAEVSIDNFIAVNNGRFAPGFLALAVGAGGVINPAPVGAPAALQGGTVEITPAQLNCGNWANFGTQMGGTSLQAVQFDVLVAATGTLGGRVTLHQGLQSLATAGACGP